MLAGMDQQGLESVRSLSNGLEYRCHLHKIRPGTDDENDLLFRHYITLHGQQDVRAYFRRQAE